MRCSSCRRSAGIASRGFSSRLTRSGASRRSRKAAGRSRQLRGHPLPPVSSPRCKVRRSIGTAATRLASTSWDALEPLRKLARPLGTGSVAHLPLSNRPMVFTLPSVVKRGDESAGCRYGATGCRCGA
eukprot:scaffold79532_cov53-Phaeocystis_antarctica.AAC.1